MPTFRLPLVEDIEPRLSDSNKDGLATNIFYDKSKKDKTYAVKRPGIASYVTGSGSALGIFSYNDELFQFQVPETLEWGDIVWNSSKFCAISYNNGGDTNVSITSYDGYTWNLGFLPADNLWQAVAWKGGKFCAVCADPAVSPQPVVTSSDGVNWTVTTGPSNGGWSDIAANDTTFLVIRPGPITTYTHNSAVSTDGVTWDTTNGINDDGWASVAWNQGAGYFCAVPNTNSNIIIRSQTGKNWTQHAFPAALRRDTICSNGTIWFTPCFNSTRGFISSNATSWTEVVLPSASDWFRSYWTGEQFVCLSSESVAYSSDGTTWSEVQLDPNIPYSTAIAGNAIVTIVLQGGNVGDKYHYSTNNSASYIYAPLKAPYPYI